jgi:hypothetical protein
MSEIGTYVVAFINNWAYEGKLLAKVGDEFLFRSSSLKDSVWITESDISEKINTIH